MTIKEVENQTGLAFSVRCCGKYRASSGSGYDSFDWNVADRISENGFESEGMKVGFVYIIVYNRK